MKALEELQIDYRKKTPTNRRAEPHADMWYIRVCLSWSIHTLWMEYSGGFWSQDKSKNPQLLKCEEALSQNHV